MKNRIALFREVLEDKLYRLVWTATLKGTGTTVKVLRNRISCVDYVTIDDGSDVLVIKHMNGKMTLYRPNQEK